MALTSYLVQDYEHQHENRFFAKLNLMLEEVFKEDSINNQYLIGNLSVNGSNLDALFINRHGFCVLEIKKYSGSIQTSENGSWTLNGNITINAANQNNPFKQAIAYRSNLIDFIKLRFENNLGTNLFDFRHIGCCVLFDGKVNIDYQIISPFFTIKDSDSIGYYLRDSLFSKKINLNNEFLSEVLTALGINETMRYPLEKNVLTEVSEDLEVDKDDIIPILHPEPQTEILKSRSSTRVKSNSTTLREDSINELLIEEKEFIDSVPKENIEKQKLLLYYLILKFEKKYYIEFKEKTIINDFRFEENYLKYIYGNQPNNNNRILTLRNQNNNATRNNQKSITHIITFFVGDDEINFLRCNKEILEQNNALNTINTILDFNDFNIINNFEFETLDNEFDFAKFKIKIGACKSFTEMKIYLEEIFEMPIEFNLKFAFYEENNFKNRLINEYESLLNKDFVLNNTLNVYLDEEKKLNELISNTFENYSITKVNQSQYTAIENSFNSRLNLITGPPGTGKTQVITNILANAIWQDKKVLVASYNNTAVNNVQTKIMNIMEENDFYFKYSTNDADQSNLLLSLRRTLNVESVNLEILKSQKDVDITKRNNLIRNIEKINNADNIINKLKDEINALPSQNFEDWTQYEDEFSIYINTEDKESLSKCEANLLNYIENRELFESNINKEVVAIELKIENSHKEIELKKEIIRKQDLLLEDLSKIEKSIIELKNNNKIYGFLKLHITDEIKTQLSNFELLAKRFSNNIKEKYKLTDFFNRDKTSERDAIRLFIDYVKGIVDELENSVSKIENHTYIINLENSIKDLEQLKLKKEKSLNLDNYIEKEKTLHNDITEAKKRISENAFESIINKKNELEKEINLINHHRKSLTEWEDQVVELNIKILKNKILIKRNSIDRRNTQRIIDKYSARNNNQCLTAEQADKFLSTYNIAFTTNLGIGSTFPLEKDLFDILIIDEASQCDFISVLPLIYRAKSVVICGDPLQFKHIPGIKPIEEAYLMERLGLQNNNILYSEKSFFDVSERLLNLQEKGTTGREFLEEHYRCHSEIVNFVNLNFYKRIQGQEMTCLTQVGNESGYKGIYWVQTNNNAINQGRNVNANEANKCITFIRLLREQSNESSIGVLTPYSNQKNYILSLSRDDLSIKNDDLNVKYDTIYNFQGEEMDYIILSLTINNSTRSESINWLNNIDEPNNLNVALTRARKAIFILGDENVINRLQVGTPLRLLLDYCKGNEKFHQ